MRPALVSCITRRQGVVNSEFVGVYFTGVLMHVDEGSSCNHKVPGLIPALHIVACQSALEQGTEPPCCASLQLTAPNN